MRALTVGFPTAGIIQLTADRVKPLLPWPLRLRVVVDEGVKPATAIGVVSDRTVPCRRFDSSDLAKLTVRRETPGICLGSWASTRPGSPTDSSRRSCPGCRRTLGASANRAAAKCPARE